MAIRRMWPATVHRARWSICYGARTRLWQDCWVTMHDPLINFALQPIPHGSVNATMSGFTNAHGSWNWSSFEHLLPHFILMQIASVMPPTPHLGSEKIYWCFDLRGVFTVRSAYDSLFHQNLIVLDKA